MSYLPTLAAALTSTSALSCQVTLSLAALTPIGVSASAGATTNTATQPAGALPSGTTNLSAQANGSYALFLVDSDVEATAVSFVLSLALSVPALPGTASAGPFEVVADLTAAVPTAARIAVQYSDLTPAGTPQPRADIDVGNDGTIEFVNGNAVAGYPALVIGPQPLQLRVVMDASLAQPGMLASDLQIVVLPDSGIMTTFNVVGCSAFGPALDPTFAATGLRIGNLIPTSTPKVFAFGLATQPLLLPPLGMQPCLLVPRPDVVLYLPSFGTVDLPLPAAVRPVTFWVQGVELSGNALLTGDGYRVDAL